MTLDEIRHWTTDRGIGHIVVRRNMWWLKAACGLLTNHGDVTPDRPRRICRECRARVALLRPVEEEPK